jgi:hypothetical protein
MKVYGEIETYYIRDFEMAVQKNAKMKEVIKELVPK